MGLVASDLVLYRGFYDDLIRLWDRMIAEQPVFDGGASRNVFKQEGKKTLAWEIAEDCGYRLPDVVVYPVAVGEAFISGWRAFSEMRTLGWIPEPPRLVAAQSARANPIATAWRDGTDLRPVPLTYTVAEGLAVGDPGAKGAWVLRLLREGQGLATESGTRPSWTRSVSWPAPRGSTPGRPGSRRSRPRAGSWPRAPSTRRARSAA